MGVVSSHKDWSFIKRKRKRCGKMAELKFPTYTPSVNHFATLQSNLDNLKLLPSDDSTRNESDIINHMNVCESHGQSSP
jgi:hypothetical protein